MFGWFSLNIWAASAIQGLPKHLPFPQGRDVLGNKVKVIRVRHTADRELVFIGKLAQHGRERQKPRIVPLNKIINIFRQLCSIDKTADKNKGTFFSKQHFKNTICTNKCGGTSSLPILAIYVVDRSAWMLMLVLALKGWLSAFILQ